MAELHVLRVFTDERGGHGNPLGVFLKGRSVREGLRQRIARELGFAETVWVDDPERAEVRILTPAVELPFAGHPSVGTAWLLHEHGYEVSTLRPPAGELRVRQEGPNTWIAARPEWAPPFEYLQLASASQVDSLTEAPDGLGAAYVWAWEDEAEGRVRARSFVPEVGVPEDEATGSAALALAAELRQAIHVRQGRGSELLARRVDSGYAEVGGRVVLDEVREYAVG
jgi:predicted PhzF superfamily epimerase YddE/YHI9